MNSSALYILFLGIIAAASAQAQTPFDQFEREVRPILVKSCYGCHSGAAPKGGLSLDTKDGMLKGGVSGPVLLTGDPEKSLLLRAVRHAAGAPAMPPGRKLTDAEISSLA